MIDAPERKESDADEAKRKDYEKALEILHNIKKHQEEFIKEKEKNKAESHERKIALDRREEELHTYVSSESRKRAEAIQLKKQENEKRLQQIKSKPISAGIKRGRESDSEDTEGLAKKRLR